MSADGEPVTLAAIINRSRSVRLQRGRRLPADILCVSAAAREHEPAMRCLRLGGMPGISARRVLALVSKDPSFGTAASSTWDGAATGTVRQHAPAPSCGPHAEIGDEDDGGAGPLLKIGHEVRDLRLDGHVERRGRRAGIGSRSGCSAFACSNPNPAAGRVGTAPNRIFVRRSVPRGASFPSLARRRKRLYKSPRSAVYLRPSSSGLGRRPFTAETRVRFP